MRDKIEQQDKRFAIVQRSATKERLPQVTWHSIEHASSSYKLPNTPNLYFFGNNNYRESPSSPTTLDVSTEVRSPLFRAVERQQRLMSLLSGITSSAAPACIYEMFEPLGNRQVKVYTELCPNGIKNFAHIKGVERLTVKIPDVRQINIVTGICLFGRQALYFSTDAGVHSLTEIHAPHLRDATILEVRTRNNLSLYEIESAVRLAGMVDDIVRALPPHVPVTVTFDVPRVDYYLYLMDAWRRGRIDRELMLEWFRLVDDRSASVIRLLHGRLCAGSLARLSVRRSSSLDELEHCIKQSVVEGHAPELSSLVAILEASDPLWSMAVSAKRPHDFQELAQMSYVVEELRASMSDGGTQLGIFIENPSEARILDASTKIAKSIRNIFPGLEFPMLGIYPLEYLLLFDNTHEGRSSLYHYDQDTTEAVDARGDVIDLLDVVESFFTTKPTGCPSTKVNLMPIEMCGVEPNEEWLKVQTFGLAKSIA